MFKERVCKISIVWSTFIFIYSTESSDCMYLFLEYLLMTLELVFGSIVIPGSCVGILRRHVGVLGNYFDIHGKYVGILGSYFDILGKYVGVLGSYVGVFGSYFDILGKYVG